MLVVYFSRAGENWQVGNVERGNTAIMVDYIKELADKTIIPFGTHGGSGVGSYARVIKEYYPNANVLESLGISGSSIRNASAKTTVENWLKRLGIDKQTTAVRSIGTRSASDGYAYSLTGQRHNGQRGIYIKDGKKIIK